MRDIVNGECPPSATPGYHLLPLCFDCIYQDFCQVIINRCKQRAFQRNPNAGFAIPATFRSPQLYNILTIYFVLAAIFLEEV